MSKFKIVVYDCEASGLNSDNSTLLCGVVRELGGKEKVFVNKKLGKDGINDKEIVKAIRDELNTADLVITFYGLGYDMRLLNTKLLGYGEKMADKKLHIDLYRVAKGVFNTSRRNLDTIARFLKVPSEKTKISWDVWREAAINGDKKALAEIVHHCRMDVRVTEQVFIRLKGLLKSVSLA